MLLYRILVPKYIRSKIRAKNLKSAIFKYYGKEFNPLTTDLKEVLSYLNANPITVFPYEFQDCYDAQSIEIQTDPVKKLKYVLQDGKRLYFKKRWSSARIRHSFNELSKEQDRNSPHRYLTDNFKVEIGEILVDIGVAEGNFALSNVEKASKLILFETDKEWIEALQATFEPWRDKVSIVNKFVSNQSNKTSTTLDDFFAGQDEITFVKIDVDGAESKLLEGCQRILSGNKPLKLAICTYHKQNDEQEFRQILTKYGFEVSNSKGYMLFHYDKSMQKPYFRRGLLRAVRS